MILGIGVDVVDLARFTRAVSRTPRLVTRLFAESERSLPPHSQAGRFAAKEALIKALGRSDGLRWHDMEIVADDHGNPSFLLSNGAADAVQAFGGASVHVSITHDAGVACAFVVVETAS